MIVVPVVLLATLFVVQYGLAYYARQVLAGATQDGAAAAARRGSSPESGAALAESLIQEGGGSLLTSVSTSGSADAETVTISAEGTVVRLLPFFGPVRVSARASASIESFAPQAGP